MVPVYTILLKLDNLHYAYCGYSWQGAKNLSGSILTCLQYCTKLFVSGKRMQLNFLLMDCQF